MHRMEVVSPYVLTSIDSEEARILFGTYLVIVDTGTL